MQRHWSRTGLLIQEALSRPECLAVWMCWVGKVLSGIRSIGQYSQPDGLLLLRSLDAIHNLESSHYRGFSFVFWCVVVVWQHWVFVAAHRFSLVVVYGCNCSTACRILVACIWPNVPLKRILWQNDLKRWELRLRVQLNQPSEKW